MTRSVVASTLTTLAIGCGMASAPLDGGPRDAPRAPLVDAPPQRMDAAPIRCGSGATSAITGDVGVWTQIAVPIEYGGCGAQSMLVDPARASDFYALACADDGSMATLKSTDYGATFTRIDIMGYQGNPSAAAVDPDPTRDPSTAPTIYAPAIYGSLGVWKTIDGGVTWRRLEALDEAMRPVQTTGTDAYGVWIVPGSASHIVVTFQHGWRDSGAGMAESKDGGETWELHPFGGYGSGAYFMATATHGTWLMIGMAFGGDTGTWRTTTCGRLPDCDGTPDGAAWTKVDDMNHFHGAFQSFLDHRTGWLYVPTGSGIRRSRDDGATWEQAHAAGWLSGVVATERNLYASSHLDPSLFRAAREPGTEWERYTEAPEAMTFGSTPQGNASSSDCDRWVVLMATDDSGIWRYVEP
jgi:hypothetical protein